MTRNGVHIFNSLEHEKSKNFRLANFKKVRKFIEMRCFNKFIYSMINKNQVHNFLHVRFGYGDRKRKREFSNIILTTGLPMSQEKSSNYTKAAFLVNKRGFYLMRTRMWWRVILPRRKDRLVSPSCVHWDPICAADPAELKANNVPCHKKRS